MKLHIYHHYNQAVERKLDTIGKALNILLEKLNMDFTKLNADIANQTTVIAGLETAIAGYIAAIKAAGTDQAQLDAATTAIEANTATLAANLVAGTPAAPTA